MTTPTLHLKPLAVGRYFFSIGDYIAALEQDATRWPTVAYPTQWETFNRLMRGE